MDELKENMMPLDMEDVTAEPKQTEESLHDITAKVEVAEPMDAREAAIYDEGMRSLPTEEMEDAMLAEDDDEISMLEQESKEQSADDAVDDKLFDYSESEERVHRSAMDLNERIRLMQEKAQKNEYVAPTRKTRREIYQTDEVETIDRSRGYLSYEDQNREKATNLRQALQSRIRNRETKVVDVIALRGTISAAEVIDGHPSAVIYYGTFRIIIPLAFLVENPNLNTTIDEDQLSAGRRLVNLRRGAEIDFFIDSFNEEERVALGNRVAWMQRERRRAFGAHGNVKAGDIVEGRITTVSTHGVTVEVKGIERRFRDRDCCFEVINDLREKYYVGQRVPVKIMAIEQVPTEDGTNKLRIDFSMKEATRKEYYDIYSMIHEGATLQGTITYIANWGIFVKVEGLDFTVRCNAPSTFATPPVGSKVIFVTTKKVDRDMLINGKILAPGR